MAEPYLSKLEALAAVWQHSDPGVGEIECRHFFSGAAAYRDGAIAATLTPVGLAFKVPSLVRDELLGDGAAIELRYFPDAPVKRDYVLFPAGELEPEKAVRLLGGWGLAARA